MTYPLRPGFTCAGLLLERARRWRVTRGLAVSEERYRNVVQTQTELICRYLPDTTLTFVNDAYCRYFGKSRAELKAKLMKEAEKAIDELLDERGELV